MAEIPASLVMKLRQETGAGLMDCKGALSETNGDFAKALEYLEIKKKSKAAKKAGRIAAEGQVASYVHTGGRIGVLVEINCETDFAAKAPQFTELVRDICLHIAASNPQVVSSDEIADTLKAERREMFRQQTIEEGKPEKMIEKITDGKLAKWTEEVSLLDQKFVKSPDTTVRAYVEKTSADIGEKIAVRRFVRFELGEGIEKKKDNFAEEVAAQAAGTR
jgi:elongation factor Ts